MSIPAIASGDSIIAMDNAGSSKEAVGPIGGKSPFLEQIMNLAMEYDHR
jgi:hypothetical protein